MILLLQTTAMYPAVSFRRRRVSQHDDRKGWNSVPKATFSLTSLEESELLLQLQCQSRTIIQQSPITAKNLELSFFDLWM